MRTVEAYFCGWDYPPSESVRREDPWFATSKAYAEVCVKWSDDSWEVLWRKIITSEPVLDEETGESDYCEIDYKPEMARAILRHFLGEAASDEMVDRLIHWPGHSMIRLEPKELEKFRQMELPRLRQSRTAVRRAKGKERENVRFSQV